MYTLTFKSQQINNQVNSIQQIMLNIYPIMVVWSSTCLGWQFFSR